VVIIHFVHQSSSFKLFFLHIFSRRQLSSSLKAFGKPVEYRSKQPEERNFLFTWFSILSEWLQNFEDQQQDIPLTQVSLQSAKNFLQPPSRFISLIPILLVDTSAGILRKLASTESNSELIQLNLKSPNYR